MPFNPTSAHSSACTPIASNWLRTDVELVQLAHRVWLEVDSYAERLELGDGFEHEARHADLLQRESDAESADSATGNEYGQIGHRDPVAWGRNCGARESLDSGPARKTLKSNRVS